MSIRNSAKAVILHEGKILLNHCVTAEGTEYYDLPGGGQHLFESMEEAIVREVQEETGYIVQVKRFLALAEEIELDHVLREQYPNYTHRIVHFFLAELTGESQSAPHEKDFQMVESVWIPLNQADGLSFRPSQLTGRITALLRGEISPFLGTALVKMDP